MVLVSGVMEADPLSRLCNEVAFLCCFPRRCGFLSASWGFETRLRLR